MLLLLTNIMTDQPAPKKSFRETFSRSHVILPVIHVESPEQALQNARLAHQEGCDGVFLINHGFSNHDLLDVYRHVSREIPDWWIGLNCLDLSPNQVFARIPQEVSGIWVDNAQIDELSEAQPEAEKILARRNESGWAGLYFGGVAFKYQREVEDLEKAVLLATGYMDVITTSGKGTGRAAELEKIRRMKEALGDFPLAIASGITPENVHSYLDKADCFLVATGISRSWTELDPPLVAELVKNVRSYQKTG
jgi:uncharacterized protein